MEIELLDLIELAIAYAKDLETKQCFEKLKKAELDLMKQDALSRREKSAALIKFISTVDIQIRKFNYMFSKYSTKKITQK